MNAFQPSLNGAVNAYVTELNPSGSALVYSSYLGGSGNDAGLGIALDSSANAYVTGNTSSSDFPTTVGALQTNLTGSSNAFVSKIACAGPGVWTQEALIPTLDSNYSAATVNGIVYAQGGCCSNSPTNNESYAYDPSTNTWSAEATQPITAFDPNIDAAVNGIIYHIGGNANGFCTNENQAYDPVTNRVRRHRRHHLPMQSR